MKKNIAIAIGIAIAVVISIMILGLTAGNNMGQKISSNATVSNTTSVPPIPTPTLTAPTGKHFSLNLTESVGVGAH